MSSKEQISLCLTPSPKGTAGAVLDPLLEVPGEESGSLEDFHINLDKRIFRDQVLLKRNSKKIQLIGREPSYAT